MFDIGKFGKHIKPLHEVMDKVYAIEEDTVIMNAIRDIYNLDIKNLPVVDDENKLVGLVTRASVVDTIYTNLWENEEEEEVEEIYEEDNLSELMKDASGESPKKIGDKND